MKKSGTKFDEGKSKWSLLPLDLVQEVVKVLETGAKNHGVDNWRNLDDAENRWFSALMRHLTARQSGEIIDPDDGLSHSSKIMCNAMFLLNLDLQKLKEKEEK